MAAPSFVTRYTRHFNRRLTLSVVLIAISQFNYGFDNQAFATTQAMGPFNRKFGECDPKTNKCDIPSHLLSLLNSLPYIGFAIGPYRHRMPAAAGCSINFHQALSLEASSVKESGAKRPCSA
jgi:hypothetical protein